MRRDDPALLPSAVAPDPAHQGHPARRREATASRCATADGRGAHGPDRRAARRRRSHGVRLMIARPDELVARACEATGLDDFGMDGWQEGLEQLVAAVDADLPA